MTAIPGETVSQREARRKRQREEREAEKPIDPDFGFAGAYGVDDETLDRILSGHFPEGDGADQLDIDNTDQRATFMTLDERGGFIPDASQKSRKYQIDELSGKLKCLSLFIRMYASQVEGKPILNIVFDDETGELVMNPTQFEF